MLLWLANMGLAGGDGSVVIVPTKKYSNSRMSRKTQRKDAIGNRPRRGTL